MKVGYLSNLLAGYHADSFLAVGKETYLSTNSICSIDLCQWKYNGKKTN